MQFVSQFCCETSCTRNCKVYHASQSTSLAIFLLQRLLHEVESRSTFCNVCGKALHSIISLLQLVSQCLYTEWLPIGF
jgi:hypothetical protein